MKVKSVNSIVFWGAMAMAFWLIDSIIDSIVFGEGSLFSELFNPQLDDLLLRLPIAALLIAVGFYFHYNDPDKKEIYSENKLTADNLQNIIDHVPQLIFWKNRDLVFMGCNRRFAEEVGLKSPSQIIGKTESEIFTNPKDIEIFHEADKRVLETGIPEIHSNQKEITGSGEEIWIDTNRMPLHDKRGNIIGILGTSEDITKRKLAEEESLQLSETLQERVNELTALYTIDRVIEKSDDLTQTLDNIEKIVLGALRNPEKAWVRIRAKETEHTPNENNKNDSSFISGEIRVDGVSIGSIDVGYSDDNNATKEEIDLITAVSGRIGRFMERMELQEKILSKERNESTQKIAAAVAHEISQPLQALTIISDMAKGDWKANIDLLDKIPEQIEKISALVEKMMDLENVKTMDYAGGVEIVDLNRSAGGKNPVIRKVLVIDDNEEVLAMITEVIRGEEIEVDSASTGEEGLEMIEKNEYGLIICDIKLPNIDGFELFKSVRDRLGATKFVFMSGYITIDKHMELISQAYAFLQKPFNVKQIINILNKIFNSGKGS
ncbi:response regulator [Candidatus Marinimicrobia bacterium MT.SAG.3]|nr:response regulator [Candidatus Marinimicrobia bacterium MT.SAG.3]